MGELGLDFIVSKPISDESYEHPNPEIRVIKNAEAKAYSVSNQFPDSLIIGADTIVYLDGEFLGKPTDQEDAKRMLELLSQKTHQVFTGVAVLNSSTSEVVSKVSETKVRFYDLHKKDIDAYVASGEPLDKAGAYAIQGGGGMFIEEIIGSYSNVVGLPLESLREILENNFEMSFGNIS
jgi:septum formation protein